MGALASNRKRRDDYFKSLSSISPPVENCCSHTLKKPKISVPEEQCTPSGGLSASSNSVVSRIARYPDTKTGFSRDVHAPVRNSRFGRFSSAKNGEIASDSKENSSDRMGIFSGVSRFYYNMRDIAMGSLRYFEVKEKSSIGTNKEKEVIEVDSEDEKLKDISDDSSIEELKVKDLSGSKWKTGQGATGNLQQLNVETAMEKEARSLDSSLVTDGSNVNTKADDMEKMGRRQLDQVPDDSGKPLYMRLLEGIKKTRDSKLSKLQFDIELLQKHVEGFHLLQPPKKEVEVKKDVADECFLPLTETDKDEISHALSNMNRRKIMAKHENSNIDITGQILQCLRPGSWLNDEVINLYLELLKEREKREPQKFLKCHFFNTFFYKKLINGRGGYNFQSVRRWTTQRKLGYTLLECDKIFVPIHKEVHWCLGIINKKDKKFQYLDSLKGNDSRVMNVLARYFVDEVKDKCGTDIDVSSWDKEFVLDLPEQENGFDCGMFMIKYADFYSRDIGLRFSQEHMPYFRLRTVKEILRLRAD